MLTPKQIAMSTTVWAILGTAGVCAAQHFWMIFPDDVFHTLLYFLLAGIGAARITNTQGGKP